MQVSVWLFFVAGALLYFIPTFVSLDRKSDKTLAIFFLNLLLGWTFIGWVVALVWSLALPKPTPPK